MKDRRLTGIEQARPDDGRPWTSRRRRRCLRNGRPRARRSGSARGRPTSAGSPACPAASRSTPAPSSRPGRASGRVVLDVVPDAVDDLHQLVADALGLADGVSQSADLQPPEIVRLDAVERCGRSFAVVNLYAQRGAMKGCGSSVRRSLDEQRVAHRLAVGHGGSMSSPNSSRASRPCRNSAPATAPPGCCRPSSRGTDGRGSCATSALVSSPRFRRTRSVARPSRHRCRCSSETAQVRLEEDFSPEHAVPERIVERRVAVLVFELDLLQQSGLLVVWPCAPQIHIRTSEEALPPNTGRS